MIDTSTLIVGKTEEGDRVIAGLGMLYFQEGLPLSVIFDACKNHGVRPSFYHLYYELKENGMTHDRIVHLLNEHVFESYGKEFRNAVLLRIEMLKS